MAWQQWTDPVASDPDVAGSLDRLERAIPMTVENWVGRNRTETDPPHDMKVIHRQYENIETGQQAAILYVRSRHPRDLIEYEPQQWYGNRGWRLLATQSAPWDIHGVRVPAMTYEFAPASWNGATGPVVSEFWILPHGRLAPTLADAQRISKGARTSPPQDMAMVRVVSNVAASRYARRQIAQTLIAPIIETITAEAERSGEQR